MSVSDGDVLRITMTWDMPNNTLAQNVFYCKFDGATTQTDAEVESAIVSWMSALYTGLLDDMSDSMSSNNFRIDKQVTEVPLAFEHLLTALITLTTTGIGDMLPHGVALVVRAGTTAIKGLARKYIPGITEGQIDNSTWIASLLTAAAGFVLNWLLGTDGERVDETYLPGVIQQATGEFIELDGEGAVATLAGYQRRRKPGVGV